MMHLLIEGLARTGVLYTRESREVVDAAPLGWGAREGIELVKLILLP
jgi:hypothetical protein